MVEEMDGVPRGFSPVVTRVVRSTLFSAMIITLGFHGVVEEELPSYLGTFMS